MKSSWTKRRDMPLYWVTSTQNRRFYYMLRSSDPSSPIHPPTRDLFAFPPSSPSSSPTSPVPSPIPSHSSSPPSAPPGSYFLPLYKAPWSSRGVARGALASSSSRWWMLDSVTGWLVGIRTRRRGRGRKSLGLWPVNGHCCLVDVRSLVGQVVMVVVVVVPVGRRSLSDVVAEERKRLESGRRGKLI